MIDTFAKTSSHAVGEATGNVIVPLQGVTTKLYSSARDTARKVSSVTIKLPKDQSSGSAPV